MEQIMIVAIVLVFSLLRLVLPVALVFLLGALLQRSRASGGLATPPPFEPGGAGS